MAEDLTHATAADPAALVEASESIPSDTSGLAEHEAAFGPVDPSLDGDAREKAEASKQRIRHRANSQKAGPDDVAAINQWTARAKAAEDAAGIARKDGESERVYRLRVRAELAERHTRPPQAVPQAQSPAPEPQPPRQPAPAAAPQPAASAAEPTRSKPVEDEVGTRYATYAEFVEDLADWKSEQRDAARQRERDEQEQRAQHERGQQEFAQAHQTYQTRLAEFVKTHPDFQTRLTQLGSITFPPAAFKAILHHEQGPAFVYHLLQHPDQLTEMLFLMEGKPLTEDNVAHATRWLQSRAQAGTTGSAAPTPPRSFGPRPPNPVRTGPHQTSEELPGDDASLAEHEHAFGKRRARR